MMEIPATPGATGAIITAFGAGGTISTPAMSYENMLKSEYEARFGAIPSGLAFKEVNEAFQGPSPFGISSVGVYSTTPPDGRPFVLPDGRVIPPPEPPPIPAEWAIYIKRVADAGAKQRREKERARKALIKTMKAAMLDAVDGLEVELDGPGKVVDHDWHDYVITVSRKDLEEAVMAAAEKRIPKALRKEASLGWIEDVPLGRVTITIKFHGKDSI